MSRVPGTWSGADSSNVSDPVGGPLRVTCLVEGILHRRLPASSQRQWTFKGLGVPNRKGDSHDAAGFAAGSTAARGHAASCDAMVGTDADGVAVLGGLCGDGARGR